jgi:putative nucleotidyltransferase with HDIG domain
MSILLGDLESLKDNNSPPLLRNDPTVGATLDALENIFLSAQLGTPLDFAMIDFAGKVLIETIAKTGVAPWIEIVRRHHSRTYQHSLLVTGIIVAFAQYLRMSAADQQRLAFAAMLHDIGKARVPVSILEKPSALEKEEMDAIRRHPEYGFESLASARGVKKDIRDAVFHHHELLDGSGYPHHLKAGRISDLVRIVTISDIFGALIEHRAYRNAMSCNAAYNILLDMGPKLDQDLRREFRFVTKLHVS